MFNDGVIGYNEAIERMNEMLKTGDKVMFHGRMIYMGEVLEVTPVEIIIHKACWLADMGKRMGAMLAEGLDDNAVVEVYPADLRVGASRGGMAWHEWRHDLPTKSHP